MSEFLAMGGYGEFVWSVWALGVVTLVYNIVAARRRLRVAIDNAALHATRYRNRQQPQTGEDSKDS